LNKIIEQDQKNTTTTTIRARVEGDEAEPKPGGGGGVVVQRDENAEQRARRELVERMGVWPEAAAELAKLPRCQNPRYLRAAWLASREGENPVALLVHKIRANKIGQAELEQAEADELREQEDARFQAVLESASVDELRLVHIPSNTGELGFLDLREQGEMSQEEYLRKIRAGLLSHTRAVVPALDELRKMSEQELRERRELRAEFDASQEQERARLRKQALEYEQRKQQQQQQEEEDMPW
jgi:hypothetical protein